MKAGFHLGGERGWVGHPLCKYEFVTKRQERNSFGSRGPVPPGPKVRLPSRGVPTAPPSASWVGVVAVLPHGSQNEAECRGGGAWETLRYAGHSSRTGFGHQRSRSTRCPACFRVEAMLRRFSFRTGGRREAQCTVGGGGHFSRNENAMAEKQGHGQKKNGWVMISDKQNTTAKKIALHERGDGVDPLLWRKTGAKRNKIHEGKMPENCVLE